MAYIVQKFGGTSVATLDLIKKAALRIKTEVDAGHRVVAVVSAMSGATNTLVNYVRDLSSTYDRAEYDTVVSSGEQVTAGLLALALQNLGIGARSWLGWQLPIYTTSHHSQARIDRIDTAALVKDLDQGIVGVVAGFQGISREGRLTTLGRGGSDTTAVALAAFLNAERCDIFTDVDGVYTADPRYVSAAGLLDHIAYKEMLELASQGAKVLQKESVEFAMKHRVRLRVLSSLSEARGTLVTSDNEIQSGTHHIRGLAHSLNEVKLTVKNLPQTPSKSEEIKTLLDSHHITIDMAQQILSLCGKYMDFSFSVLETETERVMGILEKSKNQIQFNDLLIDSLVAKVSVIGSGLQTDHSPSHKLFQTLGEKGIRVQAATSSDIKLSVLISAEDAERAISSLHTVYQLDAKD
jgi:aspartate kinase